MSRFGYEEEALVSALNLVRQLVGADAADVLAAVIETRGGSRERDLELPLTTLAKNTTSFSEEHLSFTERLRLADRRFAGTFGIQLFGKSPSDEPSSGKPRARFPATISLDLAALLEKPLQRADSFVVPPVDAASAAWIRTIAATAEGDRCHHFAARLQAAKPDVADLARLLAAAGAVTCVAAKPDNVAAVLLRAELHAGSGRPVIVVDAGVLGTDATTFDDEALDVTSAPSFRVSCGSNVLAAFARLRAVYVWAVQQDFALPSELAGIVAGCLGPLRFDRQAAAALISKEAPHLGPAAVAAIHEMVGDPRLTRAALAATAAYADANDLHPDQAATLVARSHGVRLARTTSNDVAFDPSLVMAKGVDELLARAPYLARAGARVLMVGPPAGGKSSFALELCTRMLESTAASAQGTSDVVVIAAADILAYRWGATERLLRAKFEVAALSGAPILVDELDAFAGVRGDGADSNNQHLVRCLTDEWLRNLDGFADIPVVATCNALSSIDGAGRRRFHLVVHVGDALDSARERRAWHVILGCEPPDDWQPIGAAVGDIANAGARCRMLGLASPVDLAEAIRGACAARLGLPVSKNRGRLH